MREHTIAVFCGHVTHKDDKVLVEIRCENTPVYIGDVFTAVYRLRYWRIPAANPHFENDWETECAIEEAHSCALTCALMVERIESYQRDRQEALGGDTALFTLTGHGQEYVREGWMLGTEQRATAAANWQIYRQEQV